MNTAPPHICDDKGSPASVIDESGNESIVRIYPTCSVCGGLQASAEASSFDGGAGHTAARETRLRLARSELQEWLGVLSAEDPVLAEHACRGLAAQYRRDAEQQVNPIVREFALESAEQFEAMAERLRRTRSVGGR
jgi:hypothetical protein